MKIEQIKLLKEATLSFLNTISETQSLTRGQSDIVTDINQRFEALIQAIADPDTKKIEPEIIALLMYLKKQIAPQEKSNFNQALKAIHLHLLEIFYKQENFKQILETARLDALRKQKNQLSPQRTKLPTEGKEKARHNESVAQWNHLTLTIDALNPSQLDAPEPNIQERMKSLAQKVRNLEQGPLFKEEETVAPLQISQPFTIDTLELVEMKDRLSEFLTANNTEPRKIEALKKLFTQLIAAQTPDNWNAISNLLFIAKSENKNLEAAYNIFQSKTQEVLDRDPGHDQELTNSNENDNKKRKRSLSVSEELPPNKRENHSKTGAGSTSSGCITGSLSALFGITRKKKQEYISLTTKQPS